MARLGESTALALTDAHTHTQLLSIMLVLGRRPRLVIERASRLAPKRPPSFP